MPKKIALKDVPEEAVKRMYDKIAWRVANVAAHLELVNARLYDREQKLAVLQKEDSHGTSGSSRETAYNAWFNAHLQAEDAKQKQGATHNALGIEMQDVRPVIREALYATLEALIAAKDESVGAVREVAERYRGVHNVDEALAVLKQILDGSIEV